MTHNVENLFDTKHDQSKTDYTYLPRVEKQTAEHRKFCNIVKQPHWKKDCFEIDWSETNLKKKIENLKRVHLSVNEGQGADIFFLQEVENINALNALNESYGEKKYSNVVLLEGPDLRGIDVAVLSRFPVVGKPTLHPIQFKNPDSDVDVDSRGILEVTLKWPDNTLVTVYSNHFPSPYHNYKIRVDAFEKLNSLLKSLPPRRSAIAAGDFNVPADENKKFGTLKDYVSPFWLIAHQMFCDQCVGTQYYGKGQSWSFLDMILLSKDFADDKDWEIKKTSIRTVKGVVGQMNPDGTPKTFNEKTGEGVSDHLPIYLEIFKK